MEMAKKLFILPLCMIFLPARRHGAWGAESRRSAVFGRKVLHLHRSAAAEADRPQAGEGRVGGKGRRIHPAETPLC